MSAPQIRSRKPTGRVPWPLLLVEGEEKSGKSWVIAQLSTSEKVGQMYWIDLGEGAADEYGAIPGTRYQVIEHDGTWEQVYEQVIAIKAEATRAAAAGEPPVVLSIDSASNEWDGLKDWASQRARTQKASREKRAIDPHVDVPVSMNLWNDAAARHRKLMTQLLTFPGIVVMTARGKWVTPLDDSGKPKERAPKEYRVEGHKTLAYDATLWLRMSRTAPPTVIGARSVHAGIVPGKGDPKPITTEPDNLLEWLVFDVLRCDPRAAHVRDVKDLTGGALTPEEMATDPEVEHWMGAWTDQVSETTTRAELARLWKELAAKRKAGFVPPALVDGLVAVWTDRKEKVDRDVAASQAGPVAS